MGLFRERLRVKPVERKSFAELKAYGTPLRATVLDVVTKRNGYIVVALYEDRELLTQHTYRSDLLTQRPKVYIGGVVIVYIDVSANGDYFVDC